MVAAAGNEINEIANPGLPDADWNLIRRIGTGDQAALEQLYKQYYSGLYRFVLQITRRIDSVEEVINEVMFVVWEKSALVEPRSRASTWILGIAHNKALQLMRREGSAGRFSAESDGAAGPGLEDNTPVRELESQELLSALLRSLSPEHRAVMELVYFHGLHYSEVAQVIECPENTVKTRVFHARKKLRALWPDLTGSKSPYMD